MDDLTEKTILDVAIDYYGPSHQLVKTMEELSELNVEVAKHLSVPHDESRSIDKIVTEIADVEIMLAQLKKILKIPDEAIKKEKARKLRRLVSRISLAREEEREKRTKH